MEVFQPFALLGMVLLGFGIMFQVVRPRAVWFYVIFLLFLPTLISMVKNLGGNLLDINLSWKEWCIFILVVLVGLRILIHNLFGRR